MGVNSSSISQASPSGGGGRYYQPTERADTDIFRPSPNENVSRMQSMRTQSSNGIRIVRDTTSSSSADMLRQSWNEQTNLLDNIAEDSDGVITDPNTTTLSASSSNATSEDNISFCISSARVESVNSEHPSSIRIDSLPIFQGLFSPEKLIGLEVRIKPFEAI